MMFLLENRDFPRSYFIPGRCEKTPHRHETTRKQKGTTMSRHVLFTLTLLTVNMDAENWENVRMCDVSGFCYFFFSFGGLSVHVGIGHPKNTKCAFICSIHVSVTYVKVPLTWMLKHVLLNNIQTWTFIVGFWASGRWAAVVSATSMIRSLDTPEKKKERHDTFLEPVFLMAVIFCNVLLTWTLPGLQAISPLGRLGTSKKYEKCSVHVGGHLLAKFWHFCGMHGATQSFAKMAIAAGIGNRSLTKGARSNRIVATKGDLTWKLPAELGNQFLSNPGAAYISSYGRVPGEFRPCCPTLSDSSTAGDMGKCPHLIESGNITYKFSDANLKIPSPSFAASPWICDSWVWWNSHELCRSNRSGSSQGASTAVASWAAERAWMVRQKYVGCGRWCELLRQIVNKDLKKFHGMYNDVYSYWFFTSYKYCDFLVDICVFWIFSVSCNEAWSKVPVSFLVPFTWEGVRSFRRSVRTWLGLRTPPSWWWMPPTLDGYKSFTWWEVYSHEGAFSAMNHVLAIPTSCVQLLGWVLEHFLGHFLGHFLAQWFVMPSHCMNIDDIMECIIPFLISYKL